MAEGDGERPLLVRRNAVYLTFQLAVRILFRTLYPARYRGTRELDLSGGALLVCNHQSFLDIPLVAAALDRHVCFVARDSLRSSRFMRWLIRSCGAIAIRRGQADRAALREMVEHLKAGDWVAIYPEGTRSRDGSVGEFKAGAVLVARQAGVPLIPVAIRGTLDAWPRGRRPALFQRVSIAFGQPLSASDPQALERCREAVVGMAGDGRYASGLDRA